MKNIVESWRGYVNEQEQEDADEEQVSSNEIENVGQLRTALRNYKIKKTGGKLLTKILKKGVEKLKFLPLLFLQYLHPCKKHPPQ